MKLLNKDIPQRVRTRIDKSIQVDGSAGILTFGDKNDYPQVIEKIIDSSPTASACANIYAKFLAGQGIADKILEQKIVGRSHTGGAITVKALISQVCQSISYYSGAYIHVNLMHLAKYHQQKWRLLKIAD